MAAGDTSVIARQRLERVLLAGAVSGLAAVLPAVVPVASFLVLSLVATVPLLIYGLRFGWQAAAMAGVAGWGVHGVLSAVAAPDAGGQVFFGIGTLLYVLWNVLPALGLSWLVTAGARPRTLLAALSGGGALVAVGVLLAVPELGQMWRETAVALTANLETSQQQQDMTAAQIARMAPLLPGLLGGVWLVTMMINLALATRFLGVAGFGQNQWGQKLPGFADMQATRLGVILAGVCLVAGGMLSGQLAVMLSNAGLVLLTGVLIGGLALVHRRAAASAQPGMMLVLFYLVSLVLAVPFVFVLLAGAADAFFDFRNSFFRSRS